MTVANAPFSLVAVVFKGQRHKTEGRKYEGGVLNPAQQYYVQKMESHTNPLTSICKMRDTLMEKHHAQAQAQ